MIHTIRPLCDLRSEKARAEALEQNGCVGCGSESIARLVMVGGIDSGSVTSYHARLGSGDSGILECCMSALGVALVDTTSLELLGAMTNVGALYSLEEFPTLVHLRLEVMTRMGSDGARKQSQADNEDLRKIHGDLLSKELDLFDRLNLFLFR